MTIWEVGFVCLIVTLFIVGWFAMVGIGKLLGEKSPISFSLAKPRDNEATKNINDQNDSADPNQETEDNDGTSR